MPIARVLAAPAGLEASLERATAMLAARDVQVAMAQMLDFCGDVMEIDLVGGEARAIRQVLTDAYAPGALLVAQDPIRIPDLFVSDMDSTMIGQECIDELAGYAGVKDQVAAITERAMRGELDFESALIKRVALLKGLEKGVLARCLTERITPMPGARTLVQTLNARGCRTVLVTGGFHHFADPVAEMLGFDRVVGNRLASADGKLTGKLVGAITDSAAKERVLREELAQLGNAAVSLAGGDGANDVPMLQAATYGVAVHAKPIAKDAANGSVDAGPLTAILKLFDIAEHDWVAG